jgi:DMSO/TMAO reductase YedYZ molybdopterin-dependent catalytic subunit
METQAWHRQRSWQGIAFAATVAWLLTIPAFAQQPALEIGGAVKMPRSFTRADLAKLPRTTVTVKDDAGNKEYAGVVLQELLGRAGIPQGGALRGKTLASYLLAEARDGYQVVFSLPELDSTFTDPEVLVVDTLNGKPLGDDLGPFRLLLPKDKAGARSVRQLLRLTYVRLRE